MKKINEEYTADLEERVQAEKEARELKEWRMENTRKLQQQLSDIKAEQDPLKEKFEE